MREGGGECATSEANPAAAAAAGWHAADVGEYRCDRHGSGGDGNADGGGESESASPVMMIIIEHIGNNDNNMIVIIVLKHNQPLEFATAQLRISQSNIKAISTEASAALAAPPGAVAAVSAGARR